MARRTQAKYCACGCGGLCKDQWLPGHDQRLRAAIEHEVGGLIELRRIVEERLHRSIDPRQSRNKGGSLHRHQANNFAEKQSHIHRRSS